MENDVKPNRLRTRQRGVLHIKRIKDLLRERGPMTTTAIKHALAGDYRNAPTTNQLANYLSKRKDFKLVGEAKVQGVYGETYIGNLYDLNDEEE